MGTTLALHTCTPLSGRGLGWRPGLWQGHAQRASCRRTVPRASWVENSAEVEVPAPVELCYEMWSDRARIPSWMPWIHAVEVQERDEKLSKWILRTSAFNRDWEFSWLAQNLAPVPLQKIHWRSVPGSVGGSLGSGIEVPNRGQIRFAKLGAEKTRVTLTISYEVPSVLVPIGSGLSPFVESILTKDMGRFRAEAEKELAHRQKAAA